MYLDHATIVTPDLDSTRRFFVDIAGLEAGARPPFGIAGDWLYANGRAVIHLVDATIPAQTGRSVPRIDHIAFRIDTRHAWDALLSRLDGARVRYQIAEVPLSGEIQVFVALAPGVVVEFVTALDYPRDPHQPISGE
ncbi:VOC family protein [Paraburkholderia sp.]|uniref:VOC family protein n=1 Tax=Paraburkholderia sp. TaxID=1926495 RepID=UPI00239519E8|nr:VOC family protein [Paraburkholderia sp.]MDE1179559.1 VOC family protein [Paraburkholderia sp.]